MLGCSLNQAGAVGLVRSPITDDIYNNPIEPRTILLLHAIPHAIDTVVRALDECFYVCVSRHLIEQLL